jgi:hypothetical protein
MLEMEEIIRPADLGRTTPFHEMNPMDMLIKRLLLAFLPMAEEGLLCLWEDKFAFASNPYSKQLLCRS